MDMMKVCGKMPSKARQEKNWGTAVNERAIFPTLYLISLFSLSGKSDNQIPRFPCAMATLKSDF